MSKLLKVALAGLICATTAIAAQAASVTVQLFPVTGDVRLFNPNSIPFEFIFYQLSSPNGALNGDSGVWTSISDTYDASGNGFIDPVNQWTKFTPTPNVLAEGLFATGSSLPALRSIGLGRIWDPDVVTIPDVTAQVIEPSNQNATVTVQLALAGDYNGDLKVDIADYIEWKRGFSSLTVPLADGNYDGIVDAADYTIWRNNFGASLLGAGAGSLVSVAAGGTVPEPSSGILAILTGGGFWIWHERRRRRVHHTQRATDSCSV